MVRAVLKISFFMGSSVGKWQKQPSTGWGGGVRVPDRFTV